MNETQKAIAAGAQAFEENREHERARLQLDINLFLATARQRSLPMEKFGDVVTGNIPLTWWQKITRQHAKEIRDTVYGWALRRKDIPLDDKNRMFYTNFGPPFIFGVTESGAVIEEKSSVVRPGTTDLVVQEVATVPCISPLQFNLAYLSRKYFEAEKS